MRGKRDSAAASGSPAATCVANRGEHARRARLVGLLGDGGERLVERHAGRDQRRELARQQRQQRRREAGRRGVRRAPCPGRLDRRREQSVAAQLVANRARAGGIEQSALGATGAVDCFVAKRGHRRG